MNENPNSDPFTMIMDARKPEIALPKLAFRLMQQTDFFMHVPLTPGKYTYHAFTQWNHYHGPLRHSYSEQSPTRLASPKFHPSCQSPAFPPLNHLNSAVLCN